MTSWSFGLLSPQTLAWALGGAALLTLALYFLRLRRQSVLVPFIQLWETLILEKKAAALRSQLKRWLSLLLSLLLVWALILAFSEPHSPSERRGRHIVVLIDAGLTMSAALAGGQGSCLDQAKKKVSSWLDSLGPGDEMLLVEVGGRPRPLDSFTSDQERLKQALGSLRALDLRPELDDALLLARDVLAGRTAPEVIVVSDGRLLSLDGESKIAQLPPLRFADLNQVCTPHNAGPYADNLKIDVFSARRYPLAPDRFEVLLGVSTSSSEPVAVEITLLAAEEDGRPGQVVELVRREIAPLNVQTISFVNLAQARYGLIAQIERVDRRPEQDLTDNLSRTVLSPRVPVRVLLVGAADTFLEAALLIDESLIVKRVEGSQYPPAEDFDVTIFNRTTKLRSARTGAAIYLGVPPGLDKSAELSVAEPTVAELSTFPLRIASELTLFGFDTWDKTSRIFQLIDPYDVQVLKGHELRPETSDRILGRSEGRPILVEGERSEGRFVALGFAPQDSDFVLRPSWPLFVLNLIDTLHPRGRGDTLSSGLVGHELRVPVFDAEAASAQVRGPLLAGRSPQQMIVPVVDSYAIVYAEQAGFYDVMTPSGVTRISMSAQSAQLQSGQVPERASDPKHLGPYQVTPPVGMQARSNQDPWFWLLAAVFVVSYLEWWAYHRRWTV